MTDLLTRLAEKAAWFRSQNMTETAGLLEDARTEIERLQSAVEMLRVYAFQTLDYWDRDEDHKVGKRLRAMAGVMAGYYKPIDEALTDFHAKEAAEKAR